MSYFYSLECIAKLTEQIYAKDKMYVKLVWLGQQRK